MADQGPERHDYYGELEIDLREYIQMLWRAKWFIFGLFVLAMAVAFIFSNFVLEEEYETYVTIQLTNVDDAYASPRTAREIIKSEDMAGPLIREYREERDWTDYSVRRFIDENIEINEIEDTNMISLVVKGSDPRILRDLASNLADAFISSSRERFDRRMDINQEELSQYEERIERYEEKVKETETELENLSQDDLEPTAKNLISSSISRRLFNYIERMEKAQENYFQLERLIEEKKPARVINSAFIPEDPITPNTAINMVIAGLLAIIISVLIVLFREFMIREE